MDRPARYHHRLAGGQWGPRVCRRRGRQVLLHRPGHRESRLDVRRLEQTGQITAAPNFDGDHVLIPTHNSTLYCLDKNGKKVWDFHIEGPIYGGVAVTDGKTFLAGCDSLMHVLDVKTGRSSAAWI